MQEEQKTKIHLKDIKDGIQPRDTAIFIVGDQKFWADRTTKDKLATHDDCEKCGKEFEKKYYYKKVCTSCEYTVNRESYLKLPLVEWDGKVALTFWDQDETYFFDASDLADYCRDNELNVEDLMLVTCYQTSFTTVDVCEINQENVHEDWEPDAKLCELQDALNEYLKTASTRTWMPGSKRVSLNSADLL